VPDPIAISAKASFHRRGRTGFLNELLRAASELIVPAVHSATVDFAIATDKTATHSYVMGSAKLDTYETTIVQEWARYMASHAAFGDYGVVWEAKFRTGKQGRPPAVDIVIENDQSTAVKRAALFEVKVSDGALDPDSLWIDTKKLWMLRAKGPDGNVGYVEAARFVINVVSGLPVDTQPDAFSASVVDLASSTQGAWTPHLVPVFSALFPVFRPSSAGQAEPMWIVHGVAGFEVKGP
jgi:hypothetical protein